MALLGHAEEPDLGRDGVRAGDAALQPVHSGSRKEEDWEDRGEMAVMIQENESLGCGGRRGVETQTKKMSEQVCKGLHTGA